MAYVSITLCEGDLSSMKVEDILDTIVVYGDGDAAMDALEARKREWDELRAEMSMSPCDEQEWDNVRSIHHGSWAMYIMPRATVLAKGD